MGGGLARTVDGGDTWQNVAISQEIYSLAFDSHDPSTLYAGSYFDVTYGYYAYPEGGSIFVSRDLGATWTKDDTDLGAPLVALAADPFVGGLVYAGTAGSGVLRSRDGGQTWVRQLRPGPIAVSRHRRRPRPPWTPLRQRRRHRLPHPRRGRELGEVRRRPHRPVREQARGPARRLASPGGHDRPGNLRDRPRIRRRALLPVRPGSRPTLPRRRPVRARSPGPRSRSLERGSGPRPRRPDGILRPARGHGRRGVPGSRRQDAPEGGDRPGPAGDLPRQPDDSPLRADADRHGDRTADVSTAATTMRLSAAARICPSATSEIGNCRAEGRGGAGRGDTRPARPPLLGRAAGAQSPQRVTSRPASPSPRATAGATSVCRTSRETRCCPRSS